MSSSSQLPFHFQRGQLLAVTMILGLILRRLQDMNEISISEVLDSLDFEAIRAQASDPLDPAPDSDRIGRQGYRDIVKLIRHITG